MTKKKKIIITIPTALLLIIIINFIPTFSRKTRNMSVIEGDWVNVYYETEKNAAQDVFDYADSETSRIAEALGVSEKQDVRIYIYDSQSTMQTKKYGLIAPLLGLDWYIGDNIGTDVILTSPANPGKMHSYDSVKYAVTHEITHAYITTFNPKIALWLTEGTALYLTNGDPFSSDTLQHIKMPSFEDTKTRNPVRFSECGGYNYAHTYIEYLDLTYGHEKVLELLRTEDYENVLGKSREEIYSGWKDHLYSTYGE